MGTLPAPRVRSSKRAADYTGFFEAVKEAFDLHLKTTQVPDDWKPILVEDYPKDRTGQFDHAYDVILFHIVEAQPWAMSNDGDRRQQAPMRYEFKAHPTKAGYHLLIAGWKDEAVVQFTVHSKSNSQANRIAAWFNRFLNLYIYGLQFFASRGVEKFYFLRRLEDATVQKGGQDLYLRPLQYHIRLNFLDHAEVKDLEFVHVSLHAENPDSPAVEEFDIRR